MFTWSLGWAPSPARLAITSLAFVFVRRARAGLEDVDRELVVVAAVCDLVGGRRDPLGHVGVEQAELRVGARRGGLDAGQPVHHGRGHPLA